mgnify:CR=1 FL=1
MMKKLVKDAGLEGRFEIASAATSREEIGNPEYPPAQRELAKHGISCKGHAARQMTRADYDHYDYLVAMERYNLNLSYVVKGQYYARQIHTAIKMIDIILARGGQNDYDDELGPDEIWPKLESFSHYVNVRNRSRIPRANDGGECYWSDAQQLRFDKAWMLLWKILAERSILWRD